MTVTQIRPTTTEQTPESMRLAELDRQIAAVEAKQADPQGWAKELEDERARLIETRAKLRARIVALTARTALAA